MALSRTSGALILVVLVLCGGTLAVAQSTATDNWFWGSLFQFTGAPRSDRQLGALEQQDNEGGAAGRLRHWNQIAIDASGLDHTPIEPGEERVFGEQLGPGRASLAIAIVQIAVHDALNAIAGRYSTYTGLRRGPSGASMEAAIARAAHDTLVAVFPSQRSHFDQALAGDLALLPNRQSKTDGIAVGRRAAAAILALRAGDGSDHAEPQMDVDYVPGDGAGIWRQDPVSLLPVALGAF